MDDLPETNIATAHEHVVISDEALFDRVRQSQESSGPEGDELVRRHCPMLMRYLCRLCGNATVADEMHQQTWVSVLEHADRFDTNSGEGSFKAWLFRIATNKVNDLWRSRAREARAKAGLRLVVDQEDVEASIPAQAHEARDRLQAAIDKLPEPQKQVVCMRYYGNMKFVDIAQAVGCPLNTALGRMHKALARLKMLLEGISGES